MMASKCVADVLPLGAKTRASTAQARKMTTASAAAAIQRIRGEELADRDAARRGERLLGVCLSSCRGWGLKTKMPLPPLYLAEKEAVLIRGCLTEVQCLAPFSENKLVEILALARGGLLLLLTLVELRWIALIAEGDGCAQVVLRGDAEELAGLVAVIAAHLVGCEAELGSLENEDGGGLAEIVDGGSVCIAFLPEGVGETDHQNRGLARPELVAFKERVEDFAVGLRALKADDVTPRLLV